MNTGMKITGFAAVAIAASLTSAHAQDHNIDFLNMPLHTLKLNLSDLAGAPIHTNWDGYYLYSEGGRITLLSHRPTSQGERFVGWASLDHGRFGPRIDSFTNQRNDRFGSRANNLDWDFHTHKEMAGLTFRPLNSRYLAIYLGNDYSGPGLPAIFVGGHEVKDKSGSGYILIDLNR